MPIESFQYFIILFRVNQDFTFYHFIIMREVFNLFSFDSVVQVKRSFKSCDSYSIIRSMKSINSTTLLLVKFGENVAFENNLSLYLWFGSFF